MPVSRYRWRVLGTYAPLVVLLTCLSACDRPPSQPDALAAIDTTLRRDHAVGSLNAAIEDVRVVKHGEFAGSTKRPAWRETVQYDLVLQADLPGIDSPAAADTIRKTIAPMVDGCERKGCRRTRTTTFLLTPRGGGWSASEEMPHPAI